MLLGIEFPPTSAEWTFFVAAVVILVGPLLVERIGLPGIVGVMLGGLLVGPFVLAWVERQGVVEELGQLGILFLMFLAGLELDLDEFQANRRAALTFGAFTFTLPFALGIALVLPFGYGLATALLFGSLWASHTLVAYPIVQEHGLLRDRAVGVAGSGTVMTDTLALSVLAVVAEVPVFAVSAGESDFRRVVLALDHHDLHARQVVERDLAAAVAAIAAAAARGRVLVLAPEADAGREIGRLVDDDAEVVDPRPRREALASILEADDLVLMPARGASPFHRDAAAVASLSVGCSVGVPVRPRATAGFVHATATMVAGRAG